MLILARRADCVPGRRSGRCYGGHVPTWLLVLTAILIGVVIWRVGMATVRSMGGAASPTRRPEEAEDVDDLEVFFVCRECGTEYRVTRLGELQVPRHCGEPMQVVRRPSAAS